MKKIILGLVAVLALGVLGLLGAAAMQPDHTHLERSIVVNANPVDMQYFAHDLKGVNAWSPWEGKDPNQTREYSEATQGVGAWYHWSGNDEVGEGKMVIKSAKEGEVAIDLIFIKPFEGQSVATINYAEQGDGMRVTWHFDQDNTFMSKLMMVFIDMDAMLGPDYEKGLALLKPLVEEAAVKRVAVETAAMEKAAAERHAAEAAAAGAEGEAAPAPE